VSSKLAPVPVTGVATLKKNQEKLDWPLAREAWKAAFPKLAALSTDFADIESPAFAANPAGSSVTGNVFVGPNKTSFSKSVLRLSKVEGNESYGPLRIRGYETLPEYEDIPLERVGRIG
jgi:hypothetical protein